MVYFEGISNFGVVFPNLCCYIFVLYVCLCDYATWYSCTFLTFLSCFPIRNPFQRASDWSTCCWTQGEFNLYVMWSVHKCACICFTVMIHPMYVFWCFPLIFRPCVPCKYSTLKISADSRQLWRIGKYCTECVYIQQYGNNASLVTLVFHGLLFQCMFHVCDDGVRWW